MENIHCKYCQSENVIKYGKLKDVQRYYCKDCKRKFANPDAIPKMQYPPDQIADVLNRMGKIMEQLRLDRTEHTIKKTTGVI